MRDFVSFDAAAPELVGRRRIAQGLCHALTQGTGDRAALHRALFGAVGAGFEQWGSLFCEFGWNIRIGDQVFINANGVFLDAFDITIGHHVFIGPGVGIYTSHHAQDAAQRRQYLEYGAPVVVEDDVWIGGGAIVLPGVTLGRGSIVGAGAVVTRSVPPFSKVLGARAQVLPLTLES